MDRSNPILIVHYSTTVMKFITYDMNDITGAEYYDGVMKKQIVEKGWIVKNTLRNEKHGKVQKQ